MVDIVMPSPCTAPSQAVLVKEFRWRTRSDHGTRKALATRNNEAYGQGNGRQSFRTVLRHHPPSPGKFGLTKLGSTSPPLLEQWCGFFYIPQEPDKWKCCETGSTVFRPYSRRLEILTVCRSHYKGITFCQFFNTGCWSCRGLHPQSPVRQIGDFSTETTRRQLKTVVLSSQKNATLSPRLKKANLNH